MINCSRKKKNLHYCEIKLILRNVRLGPLSGMRVTVQMSQNNQIYLNFVQCKKNLRKKKCLLQQILRWYTQVKLENKFFGVFFLRFFICWSLKFANSRIMAKNLSFRKEMLQHHLRYLLHRRHYKWCSAKEHQTGKRSCWKTW